MNGKAPLDKGCWRNSRAETLNVSSRKLAIAWQLSVTMNQSLSKGGHCPEESKQDRHLDRDHVAIASAWGHQINQSRLAYSHLRSDVRPPPTVPNT